MDCLASLPNDVQSHSCAGIARYMPRFWYRKLFTLPTHWEGTRILLNFGAVDWQCQVFVNAQEVGTHTGGYDLSLIHI